MTQSKSKTLRRDDCRLCHSSDLELVLPLTPTPLGDSYLSAERKDASNQVFPIDLYVCRSCGYAHLRDTIDPDEIYPEYIYFSKSSIDLQNHFEAYAREAIEAIGLAAGSLTVDIGSNDGMLLKAFVDNGMRIVGVDPARIIAQHATEAGLPTIPGYFSTEIATKIQNEYGLASLITANNVFANIDDLDSVTRAIAGLLSDDGVFVVEFAYVGDLIENMIFDYIYHEHLSYFSMASLKTFFTRHGLDPFYLQRKPTKGGSIRLYLQKAGAGRATNPVVEDLLTEESEKGVSDPARFRAFGQEVARLKNENLAILRRLRDEGKKIAGYGASVTSTTLIYHYGFGEFIEFLVDENPAKQNTVSPGLHLPVYHPEKLADSNVDCVLILAWRFANPVLKKLPDFAGRKLEIIIPLPVVRMTSV